MMKRRVVAIAALLMSAGLAMAEEGPEHAHDHEPKHDGILVHSGDHHLELVARGGSIELYVTKQDGKEEDVSGAKASATVLAGGKTETVTLAPSGGNALKGSGGFEAGRDATVVVSITMPGHAPEQARFRLD